MLGPPESPGVYAAFKAWLPTPRTVPDAGEQVNVPE
jgi:hypothetical protein